ncbi:Ig-like domain-containing protein [Aquimarina algiphila]|uniref:Ig-like domain-containing protein n=1 Tax=Aquimarina algiphila TaxID=2047982 RepID=UPI0023314BF9|nr:DUF6443 domain-containing protein [Aquimarina algiphila]
MITLVLMLIFIALKSNTVLAQVQGNISGPTISNIGETKRYEIILTGNFQGTPSYEWQISGGILVSQITNKADISFVDSGTVTITCIVSFSNNDQIYTYDYNVTVFPNVVAPPNPTVILGCNSATLNRTGDPDPNVIWYWQGKNPDGENFNLGNDATYTANEGSGRYYIRAYDYNGGWSENSGSVYVTIPPPVTPPSIPSITELCGSTTLSFNSSNVPNGVTWYWQSSESETDSSNSQSLISFTEGNATGNVHYIRAQNNITRCWSTATQITYNLKKLPSKPQEPKIKKDCGSTTLSFSGKPPGGVDWYWQKNQFDTSLLEGGNTKTFNTSGIYYLRARNKSNDCWGPATEVQYTVNPIPDKPTVKSPIQNCGSTILRRNNPPNISTIWYWQTTSEGESFDNNSESISFTESGVHYLKAYHKGGCWSTATRIDYIVNPIPKKASGTDVSRCGSGAVTLNATPGADANSIRWYNEAGTLLKTGNQFITPSIGTTNTYYAESYNTDTGCSSGSSNRKAIRAVINPIPQRASGADAGNCGSGTVTLNATPGTNGNSIRWYDSGGTIVSTGNQFITPTLSTTTTYYAESYNTDTGCSAGSSNRKAIRAVINLVPEIASGADVNHCGSGTVTLNATPGTYANSIRWYNEAGTLLKTGNQFITPTISTTTTYYAESYNTDTGCNAGSSNRKVIRAVINPIPQTASGTDVSRCGSGTITLTATPGTNGNSIRWYDSGGTLISTGNEFITPTISTTTAYYAETYNSATQCYASTKTPVQAKINPIIIWYADTDGDNLGDPNTMLSACTQPTGYVANNRDRCPDEYGTNQGCVASIHDLTLSDTENYIFTRVYQEPMNTSSEIKYNKDVIENVIYYDNIGREKQLRAIKASPQEKDIVTHVEYDVFGRQTKEYLPFRSTSPVGSYSVVDINTHINEYYKNKYPNNFPDVPASDKDFNAYSERILESSSLGRILKQAAPGTAWKVHPANNDDHTIKFDWSTNTTDEVIHFKVTFERDNSKKPKLEKDGFYTANQLQTTITKDENWQPGQTHPNDHTTKEYKDKRGRIVLKQTFNEGVAHDTYYVYDDFGNLTYVIPPKVNTGDGVNSVELNELCYQYKYDNRNRLIEKKIPGKGGFTDWESIIYDKLDQPILTQDANQKAKGEWLFTKYDAFGRVAYTGIYKSTRNIGTILLAMGGVNTFWETRKPAATIGGTMLYYSNDAFPTTDIEILTVNYFDDYDFDINGLSGPGTVSTDRTQSLPTGSQIKVLGTDKWITSATYYDKKGRVIYIASKNEYLNTTDIVENKLDFIGRAEETKTTHTKGSNTAIVTVDTFTYDHTGRLLQQTQKINTQAEEVIVNNTYDRLGQLATKEVGGALYSSRLQEINYTYNIRGWLKQINDPTQDLGTDLFAFKINYNTTETLNIKLLYNGNISETHWKTANDDIKRGYGYNYDNLNRLKYSSFIGGASGSAQYDMGASYDKNGNIKDLYRFDTGGYSNVMDNLTYKYDWGNKLLSVSDTGNIKGFNDRNTSGNDYDYDKNGNMTVDKNKGITNITYNHLNLPETVSISNNEGTGDISYIYSATGAKLKKIAPSGSSLITTEYAGNYIYKNGTLEYMSTPEGYATPEGSGYRYVYQYKDHLGNTRLSYTKNEATGNVEIIEESNYYPFGLTHKGYNSVVSSLGNSTAQLLKFGGKEEQNELGMSWMDFGARNYDTSLGRWMNIDPLAESFYLVSTYNYALNSPIYFIDPDGNTVTPAFKNPKNRGLYDNIINNLKNNSYFSNVYNSLDRDYDNFIVSEFTPEDTRRYGRAAAFTSSPIISTFLTSDDTRIGLRNDNIGSGFNNSSIAEEFLHAAQDQFGGLKDFFAREAEAKVFTSFLVYQRLDENKRGDIDEINNALGRSGSTSLDKRVLIFSGKRGREINTKITKYFDAILNGGKITEKLETDFRAAVKQFGGHLDRVNYGGNIIEGENFDGATPILDKLFNKKELND